MKTSLLCLLLYTFPCLSQTILHGTVKDAETKSPLSFCTISVKGTARGCIANEEGIFKIPVDVLSDTLVFTILGYKTQSIPASRLQQAEEVFLENKHLELHEITVHAGDDYLFEMLLKCRKNLQQSPPVVSKVYFQLETEIEDQPVEMLECYYNAVVKGSILENLLLKNGRIGVAPSEEGEYFRSLNTSKAISYLKLTEAHDYLPGLPLQLSRAKLKKYYMVKQIFDDENIHLVFTPRSGSRSLFNGEIWMDKDTYAILQIDLICMNASSHPFLPMFEGGAIDSVDLVVKQTYQLQGRTSILNHMEFSYHLDYNNGNLSRLNNGLHSNYGVSTTGLLYFYDYDKPFLLPFFIYDADESDYRKITSMPYNENFWATNTNLAATEKQKQSIDFFQNNGMLVNYSKISSGQKGFYTIYEDTNIPWSETGRLALKENHLDSLLSGVPPGSGSPTPFLSDKVHLQVQIFLDVNPAGDSLRHYSATIFEVAPSYYNLPEATYSDCFLNIYFDLCEIERRNMEETLCMANWNIVQVDSIYRQTVMKIDAQGKLYFRDVQSGKNTKEMEKWNAYIKNHLQLDNFAIFGLTHGELK